MNFGVSQAPTTIPVTRSRWLIAAILFLAVTVAFFDRINVSILFTDSSFLTTLGIKGNPALMGLLMTTFVFAYGVSGVLLSFSTDLMGPRKTLALCTLVLALAMGGMGVASSYALMLAGRVLLGIAEGPQFGLASAVIKRWFPVNEQGRANSIWTVGSPLGSAIGFPLIFFTVAAFGWRGSFYFLAALNFVIVLPIVLAFLKDYPPAANRPMPQQAVGAQDRGPSIRESIGVFMRDWKFWMLAIYTCGMMIYLWGFNAWLPAYLRTYRHFSIARAGLYSALPFILMFVGEVAAAWLSDRLQRRAVFLFVGLIMAGAFIFLAAISPGATAAAWCLAWSAFFWGMTAPTVFALGLQIIPAKVTAAGVGMYNGIANLVGATAPFLMGLIIGRSGNYNGGLAFLVISCIVLSLPMIPLLRKY